MHVRRPDEAPAISEAASAAAAAPPVERPPAGRRSVHVGLDLGIPAAVRVGEMLVQLWVLAWLGRPGGPSVADQLTKWDAVYYGRIASTGYPDHLRIGVLGTLDQGYEFAFYPAYPALVRAVIAVGFSTTAALLLTAALCGVAASIGVHLLTRELTGGRRAGWLACAALGGMPMAIALQMGYAESLFVAFTAFALLATVRGRWGWAGGLALLAGLTRPTGILVPLVIPLAAAATARRGRAVPWGRVALSTGVGLLGSPLFWAYLWGRTGRADAWFAVEKHGWDSHIDFGSQTWNFLDMTLRNPDSTQFMGVATTVSILAVVGGCVAAIAARRWVPLVTLTVLGAAMTLGATNYWHSKPRLLLVCFPLVVLAAPPLARMRTASAVTVVGSAVLASAWFGAYALDIWRYAV